MDSAVVRMSGRLRLTRLLAWLAAGALLLAVFLWYLSPHLVVEMAGRLWSCI